MKKKEGKEKKKKTEESKLWERKRKQYWLKESKWKGR